jgi:hypothetical protein
MDRREVGWGGGGVDSPASGQGPLAGSREHGDEPSGTGVTALVGYLLLCHRHGHIKIAFRLLHMRSDVHQELILLSEMNLVLCCV